MCLRYISILKDKIFFFSISLDWPDGILSNTQTTLRWGARPGGGRTPLAFLIPLGLTAQYLDSLTILVRLFGEGLRSLR